VGCQKSACLVSCGDIQLQGSPPLTLADGTTVTRAEDLSAAFEWMIPEQQLASLAVLKGHLGPQQYQAVVAQLLPYIRVGVGGRRAAVCQVAWAHDRNDYRPRELRHSFISLKSTFSTLISQGTVNGTGRPADWADVGWPDDGS
jgi:hypothetical protein